MKIIIEPLIGLAHIKFGTPLANYANYLGSPDPELSSKGDGWQSEKFWQGQLTIQTNSKDAIEYIGLRNLGWIELEVSIYGFDVFTTNAEKLVEAITLATKTNYSADDDEIPYSFKFPTLQMTLWREYIPNDIDDLEEKKNYETFEYIGIGIKK